MNNTSTISGKVQTAFRLDTELLRRLKARAKKENRSLNNYVETVLMDIVYDEPNEETLEALREVHSSKHLETLDPDRLKDLVDKL
ncbi:MAG: toxin-antitoxin system HicB family antitoxin [Bacteroidales bacterium]|nr:toxin-antitoxin system HicB family antitoxin [Bacteroidales bacterium]